MKPTHLLGVAALGLIGGCADMIPVEPTTSQLKAFSSSASLGSLSGDEVVAVNPAIARIAAASDVSIPNARLVGAHVRYVAVEPYAQSPTLILADDRFRDIGAEWVPGDPRRGGNTGVTYALAFFNSTFGFPTIRNPDGTTRTAGATETIGHLQAGMNAWRDRSCSTAPVTRINDPNVADIIHGMWGPSSFFVNNFPPNGANILGVTLPFVFVDDDGELTDIDGNGQLDLAFAFILYNAGFRWSDQGVSGAVDFFSVIAHEAGHAFGLSHFGKIFVTKKDALDDDGRIFADEVKYAPAALMNALYILGQQNSLLGPDNSMFCSIWGSVR